MMLSIDSETFLHSLQYARHVPIKQQKAKIMERKKIKIKEQKQN